MDLILSSKWTPYPVVILYLNVFKSKSIVLTLTTELYKSLQKGLYLAHLKKNKAVC